MAASGSESKPLPQVLAWFKKSSGHPGEALAPANQSRGLTDFRRLNQCGGWSVLIFWRASSRVLPKPWNIDLFRRFLARFRGL